MQKTDLQELVAKYLNNACTPEEIHYLNEWYNSFDNEQNPIDLLSDLQQQQLKQRLRKRIKNNISLINRQPDETLNHNKRTTDRIYFLRAIAATVLIVLGIFLFRYHKVQPIMQEVVAFNQSKNIQKLILEDGSTVWLNPNSKITYPKEFKLTKREITMSGEIFFEVKPDAKRPFIIHSDNIVTRVLGTSFLVRAKKGTPAEVSVVTGKVSVRLQQQYEDAGVILYPDQKATYSKTDNVLKKGRESGNSDLSMWRKATLTFNNRALKDVLPILDEKFGVDITTSNKDLLNFSLEADFTDQSLPSILEMLEKSLDLKYEINGRKIILIKTINSKPMIDENN
ncbi:anti-FecI sigma factor, FecR [Pseudopedobacter saltans DSM 12145]|uniref:Anti-FecI sigma factor, FecR n=1 Tax=Pseudopedobacter saltans (strain ATCC 51119 / DSM 12145 / JCM 21818 / CCUG 39354 / LMG 10337 / NBRC 100064 / NCIMB 13643) TaxID=762903 RepID=F0S692_PSESL|nr:FecR family protein [Pseudopedobacter saltans]ADY53206.1 anti-FecI sigma factor, FecR [Pseudopedobacter saltans DSM 12145]